MPITEQNTAIYSTQNSLQLRLWTVEEYRRMTNVGIIKPNEPVELVAGQIIRKMSPQKTPHATALTLSRLLIEDSLGKQVLVRTQLPVTLNNFSEPEPDIAVVMADALRYLEHHPTPTEIYLLIEIADSTLKTDCGLKAKEYASAGIEDYWVLNLIKRQLHVFREPTSEGYQNHIILGEDEQVYPLRFPHLCLSIKDMLPPTS